jgi:hypothetical protein
MNDHRAAAEPGGFSRPRLCHRLAPETRRILTWFSAEFCPNWRPTGPFKAGPRGVARTSAQSAAAPSAVTATPITGCPLSNAGAIEEIVQRHDAIEAARLVSDPLGAQQVAHPATRPDDSRWSVLHPP